MQTLRHAAVRRVIETEKLTVRLAHVETIDKSVPIIPADLRLKKYSREQLMAALAQPPALRRVEVHEVVDTSAPRIARGITVRTVDRSERLSELRSAAKRWSCSLSSDDEGDDSEAPEGDAAAGQGRGAAAGQGRSTRPRAEKHSVALSEMMDVTDPHIACGV
eukprot:m51a1_g13411 hypothetical protein (163) ;mRNA; f:115-1257